MKKDNVYLFGASQKGLEAYNQLHQEYNIEGFIDNDSKKVNQNLLGIPIYSLEELVKKQEYNDIHIIISSMYDVDIVHQLLNNNIMNFSVYHNSQIKNLNFESYLKNEGELDVVLFYFNYSGSNTVSLYKKAPEKIKGKYNIKLLDMNNKDESYYYSLKNSKVRVWTHNYLSYKESYGVDIQTWHGFPLKSLYSLNKSTTTKEQTFQQWQKSLFVPSYSTLYEHLMSIAYKIKHESFTKTGMPRNDFLFKDVSSTKMLLSRILNKTLKNNKVFLYMPTYRKKKNSKVLNGVENGYDILENGDLLELEQFLKKEDAYLLVKYHPLQVEAKNRLENFDHILNITDEVLENLDIELYEFLSEIDVLITDYSSIYFDYLLINRPIIFTPIDLEEYRENRGLFLEPYSTWAPGSKVYSINQLIEELNKLQHKEDEFKERREIIKEIVHENYQGNASKDIWDKIEEILEVKDN